MVLDDFVAAEGWAEHGPPPNLDRVAAEVSDSTCLYDTAWVATSNHQDPDIEVIENDEIDLELVNRLADARSE